MTFGEVFGGLLLAAMTALLLRETGGRHASLLVASAGIFAFLYLVTEVGGMTRELSDFAARYGVAEPMGLALRAVGIGYTTEAGSGLCRDMGEDGIARRMDAVGRISVLLLAAPTLLRLLTLATESAL